MQFKLLDLFSGIGGFSLGLERSGGFKTVAFCETEPYCRKVLNKHWPEVPCYEDIRFLDYKRLHADGIAVDAICGGFPCQDISTAGKGAGIGGERSGLWREYARLIGEVQPQVVIIENVAALRSSGRGLGVVLRDLAAIGYDAEWHCIPASAIGAPHQRDRIWIVAHAHKPRSQGRNREELSKCAGEQPVGPRGASVANTGRLPPTRHRSGEWPLSKRDWWNAEPGVGRVANGVPRRVDRLKGLGNSLVPQIPELIGRAIIEARSHAP